MAKSIKITNLPEFNRALKTIVEKNMDMQRQILIKASHDGLKDLQRTTPHKTNRARAGWNNTVDQKPPDWKPTKGKKSYSLTPFKDANRITEFSTINLSNNVEYIVRLDEGHSSQNKHMVNKMFARLTADLNKRTRKESTRRVK